MVQWFFLKIKGFFEDFSKNISPKVVSKLVKKQTGVAHVIPLALTHVVMLQSFTTLCCHIIVISDLI
jgi:hypothetical protein